MSKKITILAISNLYPSKDHPSFGTFIKEQFELLEQTKRVSLVKIVNKDPSKDAISLIVKYFRILFLSLINLRKDFDIIQVHYIIPTGLLGLFIKFLKQKPLVVTCHGGDIEYLPKKSKIFRYFAKKILQKSDLVVSVSPYLTKEIKKILPETKVKTIPMGVDLALFRPRNKIKLRKTLKLKENDFIVTYVGNISREKGIDLLIKGFRDFLKITRTEASLMLIGSVRDPLLKRYKKILAGNKNILFLGSKKRNEVARYLSASDLYAQLPKRESFGLSVLESLSSGVPALVSSAGNLKYLIKNKKNGIILNNPKPKKVSYWLDELYRNRERNKKMSYFCLEKAKKYEINKQINTLVNCYNNLLVPEKNSEDYWDKRIKKNCDLRGVGYVSFSESYNKWLYRVRKKVFLKTISKYNLNYSKLKVLDIGSGRGFFLDLWRKLGTKKITGIDFSQSATTYLRKKYKKEEVRKIDISDENLDNLGYNSYDAISAFDIFFHILDDNLFIKAIQNSSKLLKKGGLLIFTDNFIHKETKLQFPHQVNRPLKFIKKILENKGFEIIERRPIFYLMNYPVDSKSKINSLIWKAVTHPAKYKFIGWLLGAVLYPLELVLTSILKESPTTEIMICRKKL